MEGRPWITLGRLREILEDFSEIDDETLVMVPTENSEYGSTYLQRVEMKETTLADLDESEFLDEDGNAKVFDVLSFESE